MNRGEAERALESLARAGGGHEGLPSFSPGREMEMWHKEKTC